MINETTKQEREFQIYLEILKQDQTFKIVTAKDASIPNICGRALEKAKIAVDIFYESQQSETQKEMD